MNRLRALAAVLLLTPLCAVPGHTQDLKLLISVEEQNIVAPNPIRATLHFHNSGQQTLWLYRPVGSKMPGDRLGLLAPVPADVPPGQAYGGSQLEIRLAPQTEAGSDAKKAAGGGFAMAPDALPHPRLVHLAPGADYQERVSIHVEPGKTGGDSQPIWGAYKFSVIYSAGKSLCCARRSGCRSPGTRHQRQLVAWPGGQQYCGIESSAVSRPGLDYRNSG